MKKLSKVCLTRRALKDLERVPLYIVVKLQAWIDDVEMIGIAEVRKIPGYHDEPLKGVRSEQRSIRLNRSYRAIYIMTEQGCITFVKIIEVNKHDY